MPNYELTSSIVLNLTNDTLWIVIFISLLLGALFNTWLPYGLSLIPIVLFTISGNLLTHKWLIAWRSSGTNKNSND